MSEKMEKIGTDGERVISYNLRFFLKGKVLLAYNKAKDMMGSKSLNLRTSGNLEVRPWNLTLSEPSHSKSEASDFNEFGEVLRKLIKHRDKKQ